ncbi:hypothetical protein AAE478_004387 [Parahypoxylon ruwenzoriense]
MRLGSFSTMQALWPLANGLPNPTPMSGNGQGICSRDLPINTVPDALRLNELFGAPDNNFDCKSERNPVVTLHGLGANRDTGLNRLQWELNGRGYCTFSLTYGAWDLVPWLGGLRPLADSAKEIASFVREVKDRTGAGKVDIVGHSEGGVQSIYVPMTQPGMSDIVEHVVALGPAIHGAQYLGVTDLLYIGGNITREIGRVVQDVLGCPACDDLMTDGAVYNDFKKADKIVQPGNKVTIVMSESDVLVSPGISRVDEPGVNNVVVQDTCPDDNVGHSGLVLDKGVWRLVLNALEENDDKAFGCEKGLPL